MEALDSALPCKLDGKPCAGRGCPFWIRGECLLVDVDLRGRSDLIRWLLELRRDVETPPRRVSPR